MSAKVYPKIDTLFERDKDTFKVDETKIRREEFTIPSEWVVTEKIDGMNIRVSLEHVACRGEDLCEPNEHVNNHEGWWKVKYYGRGENSQFPPLMLEHLQKTFTLENMQSLWRCKNNCRCLGEGVIAVGPIGKLEIEQCPNLDRYQITLYGEGYGAGIQTGGGYNKDKTFRLFDVLVGETWLSRENVEDVAKQLEIECAPLIIPEDVYGKHYRDEDWDLFMITDAVKKGIPSCVAQLEGEKKTMAEGIVAQTKIPLFNSRGQRLMFKLKSSDFA